MTTPRKQFELFYNELHKAMPSNKQSDLEELYTNTYTDEDTVPPESYYDYLKDVSDLLADQKISGDEETAPDEEQPAIFKIILKIYNYAIDDSNEIYKKFVTNFSPKSNLVSKLEGRYNPAQSEQFKLKESKSNTAPLSDEALANLDERMVITEVLYQLNFLKSLAEDTSQVTQIALTELFRQTSDFLANQVEQYDRETNVDKKNTLLSGLSRLALTIDSLYFVIYKPEDPKRYTKFIKNVNKLSGHPSICKKVIGAFLLVAGAVLLGVCLVATFHSGGLSLLGLPIGKKLIALGIGLMGASFISSACFFASGRRKGLSKTAVNAADTAKKEYTAPSNG